MDRVDTCGICHRAIYYSVRRRAWLHIARHLDARHQPTREEGSDG